MTDEFNVRVNGKPIAVSADDMASTALAKSGLVRFRTSTSGMPRGPLCGMGICFECRVTIDGRTHQRSCQTVCRPDMEIQTDKSVG